jgi:hypothetical protein
MCGIVRQNRPIKTAKETDAMFQHKHTMDPNRPSRGFFSTLAVGGSVVVATAIVCGTVVVSHGLSVLDSKADHLVGAAQVAVENLPELIASLPPILSDLVNDERRPDYAENLTITARWSDHKTRHGGRKPIIEVENRGTEMVSLLSMRVIVQDDDGDVLLDRNEWAATPVAAEHDWRGPLMPGAKRVFLGGIIRLGEKLDNTNLHLNTEITDIRVWQKSTEG